MNEHLSDALAAPPVVGRDTYQTRVDAGRSDDLKPGDG